MFDSTFIAGNVADWAQLGVKLPKDLQAALDAFDALRWVEVEHPPVFHVADVTADNAEDKVREYAEHLVTTLKLVTSPGAGGVSVLAEAKRHAVATAARRVNAEAAAAIPEIIEKLTPEFDKHAAAYVDAVAKLPEDLAAETLVAAGADAVVAYADAQREAGHLNLVSSWVASTRNLPGHSDNPDPVLSILRPHTAEQLAELDKAHRNTHNTNPTLAALNPVWFTAAREGVEFAVNTVPEAALVRAGLR
jgi:uncharacterized protein YidB (DUF937 family)